MKTYRIKVTKDEKEMIESALLQSIDLTKDAIRDCEVESLKELKQEMKLMRESLRAVRVAKPAN